MTDPAVAAYFDQFTGLLGSKQLPQHIVSMPDWWRLKDNKGETPLMRALGCKGATPALLDLPGAHLIHDAVDHQGHNLWFHLFVHHRRWSDLASPAHLDNWKERLAHVPPQVSPQTNRGWMIEMGCRPRRGHGTSWLKAPAGPTQRSWAKLTSGPAHLWWLSSNEDAQRYLNALTQHFRLTATDLIDLHRFIGHTLPRPFPAWMPQPLQDALHLPGWLTAQEEDEEAVQKMHEAGRCFSFSAFSLEAVGALQTQENLPPNHVARCLAANNAVVLDTRIPAAKVSVSRRPRI